MPFDPSKDHYYLFDLTNDNAKLKEINLNNKHQFEEFITENIRENSKAYGVGKYNEDRLIYQRSDMFSGEESRSLHLGIDIWAPAGTEVYAPLEGTIHSFADNHHHGDYGPTIILEHEIDGRKFHTLYGHLSKESLVDLAVGKQIKQGELFAWYGHYEENVHWPPHLHFQVIEDMQEYAGDYPGVCKPSEKEQWLANCPNPNLILNIEGI